LRDDYLPLYRCAVTALRDINGAVTAPETNSPNYVCGVFREKMRDRVVTVCFEGSQV
jgi:hypothetical protein